MDLRRGDLLHKKQIKSIVGQSTPFGAGRLSTHDFEGSKKKELAFGGIIVEVSKPRCQASIKHSGRYPNPWYHFAYYVRLKGR